MSPRSPWTYERVIAAIQRWAAEHGGRPPVTEDWRREADDHPSHSIVGRRWGWSKMIAAAGFPAPKTGGATGKRGSLAPSTALGDDRPFPMSGTEAGRFGAIVSFENADGKRLALHRVGAVRRAVAQALEDALRADETFRVVSISTPTSVYRDLQGHRLIDGNTGGRVQGTYLAMPEVALVPPEMLHESLQRYSAGGRR